MIKESMVENLNSAGFIISGYPRQVNQGVELEREVLLKWFILLKKDNTNNNLIKDMSMQNGFTLRGNWRGYGRSFT